MTNFKRPLIPDNQPDWTRAACFGEQQRHFYPAATSNQHTHTGHQWSKARLVCQRCPIRDACLDYAIALDDKHGMWGGRTPSERASIARHRKTAA